MGGSSDRSSKFIDVFYNPDLADREWSRALIFNGSVGGDFNLKQSKPVPEGGRKKSLISLVSNSAEYCRESDGRSGATVTMCQIVLLPQEALHRYPIERILPIQRPRLYSMPVL